MSSKILKMTFTFKNFLQISKVDKEEKSQISKNVSIDETEIVCT